MKKSATSVLVFGAYLVLLGTVLTTSPNLLLNLVGVPSTSEVWIRLVGMLLVFMGFFYIQAGRTRLVPFIQWTLYTRLSAILFLFGFVLSGLVKPVILLFWLGDVAGALWTGLTLAAEKRIRQQGLAN